MINKSDKKSKSAIEKIETIEKLCSELDLEFDNTWPNHYKIIIKIKQQVLYEFEFSTYNDVINALELLRKEAN